MQDPLEKPLERGWHQGHWARWVSRLGGRLVGALGMEREVLDPLGMHQEVAAPRPLAGPRPGTGTDSCPVPRCNGPCSMEHVTRAHLPAIFTEGSPVNLACSRRRIGAVKLLAVWVLGTPDSLRQLPLYIDSMGLLREVHVSFSPWNLAAMEAVAVELVAPLPTRLSLAPVNSPAVLIHWRALVTLLAQVEPRYRSMYMCGVSAEG